jgi:hypothetical protein
VARQDQPAAGVLGLVPAGHVRLLGLSSSWAEINKHAPRWHNFFALHHSAICTDSSMVKGISTHTSQVLDVGGD